MFDPFTDRAKKALSFAHHEAMRLERSCIGTEHILLGLAWEGGGTAASVLRGMSVDIERIRREIDKRVVIGPPTFILGQIPFTPRARKVLEWSLEEARKLCHNHIGTAHLLLGLLRQSEGIAAQVLLDLGVELEVVREALLEEIGASEVDRTLEPSAGVHEPQRRTDTVPPAGEALPPSSTPFDGFTDRAKCVMSFARLEAMMLNHEYIGTEHILLGLVREGSGVAARVLGKMNAGLDQIRCELDKFVESGSAIVPMGPLPFTQPAQEVLESSRAEATQSSLSHVGTEHLLLGLLRENEGIAARALRNVGIELEAARKEVLESLGTSDNRNRISNPGGGEHKAVPPAVTAAGRALLRRFTDRALKVLGFARQEAMKFHHECIGTEHILLGLVQEGSGFAANVLKDFGVDLEKIRQEVEEIVLSGPSMSTMGQLQITPRARRVLELSIEEANQLCHDHIGTEHLLLGLIRENEGIAAQALWNLGVGLDEVREEVLERSGNGDQLKQWVQRYRERVHRIFLARLGSRSQSRLDADDILQSIFAMAFANFDRFEMRHESSFLHWLAEYAERHPREVACRDEAAMELPPAVRVSPDDAACTEARNRVEDYGPIIEPVDKSLPGEREAAIEECLAQMAEPLRVVIVLRDYHGLEWNEVAAKMGGSEAAARELHRRALLELAKLLRRHGLGSG